MRRVLQRHKVACSALFLVTTLSTVAAWAGDWPHPRGPAHDGATAAGVLSTEGPGLRVAWKVPLGSGYSVVAVSGERAVALFSGGESDYAVALHAKTGDELWRHELGPKYAGHDGSDDGPLSSPVIDDGRVFVLSPHGRLAALKLADGKQIWSRSLPGDFGAEPPFFGFTTTPLVEGEVLVVQTGGPGGKAVSGLDKRTGEVRWSTAEGKVSYQSPVAMTLAGRRQVVAVAGKAILGIAPQSGEVLWRHTLGEDESASSAQPTFLGGDRFLLFVGHKAVAFEVAAGSGGFTVKEVYRTSELGNTYAAPVVHDGHLYGFRREVLTCARADTGERVWKSREPGGKGLILVDGHLVIFGARGNVVVARATPEGYHELTRVTALERSAYTWPSFGGGKILVRNLEELAAIEVVAGKARAASPATPAAEVPTPRGKFGEFVEKLRGAENKAELIDKLLREERFPIVEKKLVHFVYHGEAEDVAIEGPMLEARTADTLHRVAGTNLFHRTYELSLATRWEYRFIVDFEQRVPDPLNPRRVPARWDETEYSELAMPYYSIRGYLEEPEGGRRGRIESFELNSAILGDAREIQVYLPQGYDAGRDPYHLLIVNGGPDWLEKGRMANSLDNLIGDEIVPVIAVFVEPAKQWWAEAGGAKTADYVRMLVEELLPQLAERYRTTTDAKQRAVMGAGGFGTAALYAALAHPGVFGGAAAQSISLREGAVEALLGKVRDGKPRDVHLYLDWNVWEDRSVDDGYDLRQDGLNLATALVDNGFHVSGGEMNDSAGWGGWRSRTHRILEAFLPRPGAPPTR